MKNKSDKNGFKNGAQLLRSLDGKFINGNSGGPGRPPGALGSYNQIRKDILDCWFECNGKERFKKMLQSPFEFKEALAIVLAMAPKLRMELKQDLEGNKSVVIEEENNGSE